MDTTGFNPPPLWKLSSATLLLVWLALAPVFLVTVRSWSGAVLILGSLGCLVGLLRQRQGRPGDGGGVSANPVTTSFPPVATELRHQGLLAHSRAMVLTLVAPVLVIALTSLLRGQHAAADYDAPARFLLAALVFGWMLRQRASALHLLQYTIPLGLIVTLLQQFLVPQQRAWGDGRMSTYFADPLVFGYTSITLGLICLVSIHLLGKDRPALVALKLAGAVIGFYLSVQSVSRTGWLAAPLVLALWLYYRVLQRGGFKGHHWSFLGTAVLLMLGLASSDTVQQRLAMAVREVLDYPWSGMAPETSVGLRITFLRIAADLFASNPWLGFGDTRQDLQILPAAVYQYATEEARHMALVSGFHNEVVTQAIRSGVAGLLSALALFVIPMRIFVLQIRSSSSAQRGNAMAGLVLTLGFGVSSLSTEVFDLKYTASFYALMVAMLSASALVAQPPQPWRPRAAGPAPIPPGGAA